MELSRPPAPVCVVSQFAANATNHVDTLSNELSSPPAKLDGPMEPQYAYKVTLVLASVLEKMANTPVPSNSISTVFDANTPPKIGVQQYLERIFKYTMCSGECYVLALIYIDRFRKTAMQLTPFNIHRVIITSVMLAAKFFEDAYYNNAYFAQVGGVPTVEINQMELDFLFYVSFRLHVPTHEYQSYRTLFHNRIVSAETPTTNPTAHMVEDVPRTPQSSQVGVSGGRNATDTPPTQKQATESLPDPQQTQVTKPAVAPQQSWPQQQQQQQWSGGNQQVSWQQQQQSSRQEHSNQQEYSSKSPSEQQQNQQNSSQEYNRQQDYNGNNPYGSNAAVRNERQQGEQQWDRPWQASGTNGVFNNNTVGMHGQDPQYAQGVGNDDRNLAAGAYNAVWKTKPVYTGNDYNSAAPVYPNGMENQAAHNGGGNGFFSGQDTEMGGGESHESTHKASVGGANNGTP
jgi:hypothetical protein